MRVDPIRTSPDPLETHLLGCLGWWPGLGGGGGHKMSKKKKPPLFGVEKHEYFGILGCGAVVQCRAECGLSLWGLLLLGLLGLLHMDAPRHCGPIS